VDAERPEGPERFVFVVDVGEIAAAWVVIADINTTEYLYLVSKMARQPHPVRRGLPRSSAVRRVTSRGGVKQDVHDDAITSTEYSY
jgi:hypothetical protein